MTQNPGKAVFDQIVRALAGGNLSVNIGKVQTSANRWIYEYGQKIPRPARHAADRIGS